MSSNRGHLIRLTKASFDTISHLAVLERCPKAEIVRRALDAYVGRLSVPAAPVTAIQGPPMIERRALPMRASFTKGHHGK